MFSVPVLLAISISMLICISIVNIIIRKRKSRLLEKIDDTTDNCEVNYLPRSNKNCWCSEYDLSKAQRVEIFEKYGNHFCGKDPANIIKDNQISSSVAEKFNVHDTLTRVN